MYTYNLLYKNCDSVLKIFTEQYPRFDLNFINQLADFDNPSQTFAAVTELINQGCLEKDNYASSNWYIIKSKGLYIKENGGFKEYLKELNRQDELKKLLDDYSLRTSQSVIDTNALVGQNVRTQERLTKYALTIAFFAALFPAITLVKDILQPQQLIDKDTQQTMKKQQESIQPLQQSLDTLNLSIKNLNIVSYKIDTTKK